MPDSPISRRALLKAGVTSTLAGSVMAGLPSPLFAPTAFGDSTTADAFRSLEARHQARLGVWAVNHRSGAGVTWRSQERFPFCSTYKGLLAAQVLDHFAYSEAQLNRVVHYSTGQLIEGSPVTTAFQSMGLTVGSLCAAALAYSDNTAANLLFDVVGGPPALTRYLRSIGDRVTRSDRTEPSLNNFARGDTRDTTTAEAIGRDYTELLLGRTLHQSQRAQLLSWMRGDAVNVERFRAGLPSDWVIADKTGTGNTAIANDVGVAWTPQGTALSISIFSQKHSSQADPDSQLVAEAARVAARALV